MRKILVEQISRGVNNFFSAYKNAFDNKLRSNDPNFRPEKLNIFLAGKSSQSPILKECFDKWFADHKPLDMDIENKFEIYPPLGTAEADEKLGKTASNGMKVTGKTGVAFGLIECRESGRIRVINDGDITQSARFEYCIGKAIRNKFIHITDKSIVYGQWYKYLKASRTEVELYYSSLAESANDTLDVSQEEIRHVNLSQDTVRPDSFFVYRATTTDTIEYAVAESPESAQNDSILYGPIQIKLK